MTSDDRFGGTVSVWLQRRAGTGTPDYLDDILGRTARTRQRPGWTSFERWPPMDILANRTAYPSRFQVRSIALLVILALLFAAIAAVLVAGSRPRLPEPFGPARNGVLLYGSTDGDIYAFDPDGAAARPLITGPGRDETPDFAPDGTSFVYAHETDVANVWQLMVANADGSNRRPLTGPIYPEWNAWSPDSTRVAVVNRVDESLRIYSLDGSPPVALPIGMKAVLVGWRSPSDLVFLGSKAGSFGLYSIGLDDQSPHALLPATRSDGDWMNPALSPDGSRITWSQWQGVPGKDAQIHVLDLETGEETQPVFEGTNLNDTGATWSPDGASLIFSRWVGTENRLAIGPVEGGTAVEMGPGFPDFSEGAVGASSPDGTKIVARYGFDPDALWILDTAGGPGERVLTDVADPVTWQRLAP